MTIPRFALPVLVVVFLVGGFFLRLGFTAPTTQVSFQGDSEVQHAEARLECVVQGLKCKGTAAFFTSLFEGTPGIASIETFATEHVAVFTYDPAVIDEDRIQGIIEAPVPLRDGTHRQVFQCLEIR
jgi:hypothetical protein